MRLLHIMAGRGLGGAETYATDMILSLHEQGVDQCVVMSDKAPRYGEMRQAGIRFAPEVLSWRLRFLQRWRLKKLIAQENPDLIHCWMRRAASLVPKNAKKIRPVIGWFGGYYEPKNFTACSTFVGVTKGITDHMVERGVAASEAVYIPTFPDIQPLPPIDRQSVDTPADAPVLLALSRLHSKKGLDVLLKAVANLSGVYLWLAGEGPLRAELEALTASLNMQDRVRFLGWRTDRAALLRAANVCVLPSRYEPFGTVILEAWAAKTPFVACASAGPAAHVNDGENGLLVAIDDIAGLQNALARVLSDKALRDKIVSGGYETYLSRYTREAVTAQMRAHYDYLINSFGKTR